MRSYDDFIISLIKATEEKKMKWLSSSIKGGYISKIEEIGIEILPPSSESSRSAVSLAITALPDSRGRDEFLAQREWRVVVYSSGGERDFIILESKLDHKYISISIGKTTEHPIRMLLDMVIYSIEESDSLRLKNLINKIKNL